MAPRVISMGIVTCAAVVFHTAAMAQDKESPEPAAPAEEARQPAATDPPSEADPKAKPSPNALHNAPLRPSRYVSENDLPAYVQALTEVFSISRRVTDPFGQLQDPNAKPIVKPTPTATTRRVVAIQPTSFPDIVSRIKVNTVMPGQKQFLIGNRTITQGDEIPLNFRGRAIMVRVTKVNSRAIEFHNIESGETAKISLSLLPDGMKAGRGDARPPGMIPETPNAPIDIDPGDSPKIQP